jgi:hypothetical protein
MNQFGAKPRKRPAHLAEAQAIADQRLGRLRFHVHCALEILAVRAPGAGRGPDCVAQGESRITAL